MTTETEVWHLSRKIGYTLETGVKLNIEELSGLRVEIDQYLSNGERNDLSNLIRGAAQNEAITEFKSNGYWGCVFMATGSGKSRIGVMLSDQISLRLGRQPKILLVVPTKNLRDKGWKQEFDRWSECESYNNVETCCYASLIKYTGEEFDLVILDEGHNLTPNNAQFFDNNEVRACIVLTGTKPKDQDKIATFKRLRLNPIYELTLDECVKIGLTAPYEIFVVTTTLDDVDKYIEAGKESNRFKTTEKKQYKYLTDKTLAVPSKFNFMHRARFIYNLKSKTIAASKILEHLIPGNLRTVIFCGSIDQANKLCPNRYHSKTTDQDLSMFLDGKISRIACVDAINEGINIENIDLGLIVQLTSSDTDLFQRLGRFLRYKPNHIGRILILVCKDTVDKDWFVKATTNIDPRRIRVISIEDLKSGNERINFNT